MKREQETEKMFCKVCKDAGKCEKEYTNHFVKNKTGNVICPTLLNQECRYCKGKGHTVKFCSTLKKKLKDERNDDRYEKYQLKKAKLEQENAKPKMTLSSNQFAAAFESDSEDETNEQVDIDLNEKVLVATHYIRSYASVLVDDSMPIVENVKSDKLAKPTKTSFKIDTSNLKGKFWGDDDSDSDEDF